MEKDREFIGSLASDTYPPQEIASKDIQKRINEDRDIREEENQKFTEAELKDFKRMLNIIVESKDGMEDVDVNVKDVQHFEEVIDNLMTDYIHSIHPSFNFKLEGKSDNKDGFKRWYDIFDPRSTGENQIHYGGIVIKDIEFLKSLLSVALNPKNTRKDLAYTHLGKNLGINLVGEDGNKYMIDLQEKINDRDTIDMEREEQAIGQ